MVITYLNKRNHACRRNETLAGITESTCYAEGHQVFKTSEKSMQPTRTFVSPGD